MRTEPSSAKADSEAFTLLELLVSIGVIAVLAVLAIGGINTVKQHGVETPVCDPFGVFSMMSPIQRNYTRLITEYLQPSTLSGFRYPLSGLHLRVLRSL